MDGLKSILHILTLKRLSALNTYRVYKRASVVSTPQNVEDIRGAIYTAISQGVISQEEKTSISLPVR